MHSSVHSSTIYKSQDREATRMSISRGLDEENVVHLYRWIIIQSLKRME